MNTKGAHNLQGKKTPFDHSFNTYSIHWQTDKGTLYLSSNTLQLTASLFIDDYFGIKPGTLFIDYKVLYWLLTFQKKREKR